MYTVLYANVELQKNVHFEATRSPGGELMWIRRCTDNLISNTDSRKARRQLNALGRAGGRSSVRMLDATNTECCKPSSTVSVTARTSILIQLQFTIMSEKKVDRWRKQNAIHFQKHTHHHPHPPPLPRANAPSRASCVPSNTEVHTMAQPYSL